MNIPNLPVGRIIEDNGNPTDQELTFRQNLISELQKNVGKYFFAPPQLSSAEIAQLELATEPSPAGGVIYVVPFGAWVYNTTTNAIMFAVDNGSGAPIFKTATLT